MNDYVNTYLYNISIIARNSILSWKGKALNGWDLSTGYDGEVCISQHSLFNICAHRSTFRSKENVRVTSTLINEVRSLNPSFDSTSIRGISSKFF